MTTSWMRNGVVPVDPRSAARLVLTGKNVALGERRSRGFKRVFVAPRGHCRECHRVVPPRRQTWCSQECVDRSGLNWNETRAKVFARDQHRCAMCHVDIKRSMLLWRRIRDSMKVLRIYDHRVFDEAKRACGWNTHTIDQRQADHIVARADGGADHPDNLRTLCVPCHKERTAAQRRDWAEQAQLQSSLFAGVTA